MFSDEKQALQFLKNISYYRLKGYWWDMQADKVKHQRSEKAIIANEMGLTLHSELSSWLESIAYVRNIIAHHSRLWSRNMVKTPVEQLNNPSGPWFSTKLLPGQVKKPFLIISCMVYICNATTPGHQIQIKLKELFQRKPKMPIYKLGLFNPNINKMKRTIYISALLILLINTGQARYILFLRP